jgi:hypothetical protein
MVTKTKELKIKKNMLSESAFNVIITLKNGKVLDVTIPENGEYVIINHLTTINDITFCPLNHDSKVEDIRSNGSVYSVKFTEH